MQYYSEHIFSKKHFLDMLKVFSLPQYLYAVLNYSHISWLSAKCNFSVACLELYAYWFYNKLCEFCAGGTELIMAITLF